MKRFLIVALVAMLSAPALAADPTVEVLVLATATPVVTGRTSRRAVELQNLGPAAIYCSLGGTPVMLKTRRLQPGETWQIDVPTQMIVSCIAAAPQVTGAATIVTDAP